MFNRRKWWILSALVLSAFALELGVRFARPVRVCVVLINGGAAPIRNVTATYEAVESYIGDVAPGASTLVQLENGPKADVALNFAQEGNPMTGAILGGDELAQARRDGLRLVLSLRPGQVVRYMEADPDSDDPSPLLRRLRRLWESLSSDPPSFFRNL